MGTGSVHHLGLFTIWICSLRDLLAVCLTEVMGTGSIHHLGLFTIWVCSLRDLLAVCQIQVMGTGSVHHLGLCALVFYMLCVCFSQL